MDIWTGFIIGFFGSFHCVGMCGPIALALPIGKTSHFELVVSRIFYNLGRVVTYSVFGAIFGLFGTGMRFAGIQSYLSVAIGVVILTYYLMPARYRGKFAKTSPYRLFSGIVKKGFAKLTKTGSPQSLFLFGIINGLLPCGFVYVALAGAITTGSFISGALFMALFGLGTTPIMLATSLVGKFLNVGIKQKMNKLIPLFAIVLAVIFILRGLNLGIRYISPPEKMLKPHTTLMNHSMQ